MRRWNFCPVCGHRVYKHGSDGCEHVDIAEEAVGAGPLKVIRRPCDCDAPIDALVVAS
ncbi:hypothetical protein [Mycobacterium palustre]|uniref:hypothetical protein n=1 Tax=Mycobacterium palustre TaxID=153971 RepID=UPI0013022E5A|nr:hypothetical protein [Mycobacterium palustre]MCV7100045.1 hypothetical protein [Mycobacterium palustre]